MKVEINYMQMVDLWVRVLANCEGIFLMDNSGHCHGLVLGKERGQSGRGEDSGHCPWDSVPDQNSMLPSAPQYPHLTTHRAVIPLPH